MNNTTNILLVAVLGVGGFLLYRHMTTPPMVGGGSYGTQGGVGSGGSERPTSQDESQSVLGRIQSGAEGLAGAIGGIKGLWESITGD